MSQQSPRRQKTGDAQVSRSGPPPQEDQSGDSKTNQRDCPECEGATKREDTELVCSECGLVIDEDTLSRVPQWKSTPGKGDGKSLTTGPEVQTDRWTSSTVIGDDLTDGYGREISAKRRGKFQRLKRLHQQQWKAKQNTSIRGVNEIERMGSALDIPSDVREMAIILFKRGIEQNVVKGRSIEGVASAAVYIASRKAQLPYALDDIVRVLRLTDRTRVGRVYRDLVETLGMSVPLVDASGFISRFTSALDLSVEIEQLAKDILEAYRTDETAWGRDPTGVAAAVIYAACCLEDLGTTQQAISEVADVSALTIREQYRTAISRYREETQ